MFSPMEQFVAFPILYLINSTVLFMLITFSLYLIQSLVLNTNNKLIGNSFTHVNESNFHIITNMIVNYVNKKYIIYVPLILSVYNFILLNNYVGLMSYTITPTVEIIMTLSISLILLLGILIIGIRQYKWQIIGLFVPAGVPNVLIPIMLVLEIVAYFTRILSLGLRLGVNMITGHILTKVILGFIWSAYLNDVSGILLILPLSILSVFLCLEILISYLQTYIFIFITLISFKDITK